MLNRLIASFSLIALLFIFPSDQIHARDLGKFGATFPIAEKNALQEMTERAKEVDWGKVFDRDKAEKKIKNYRPAGLMHLPAAAEDRIFQVDMTWSSEFDVPDGKGGILYPKGYTFNPLDYVFLPNILVFVNAADRRQIEWFKKSPYKDDMRTMLLLTGGSYWDTMNSLKIPAFYANRKIIERFQLVAVPSVVVQKGNLMEVREYVPDPDLKSKGSGR